MSKQKIEILLVDDHRLLISGLALLLNSEENFQVVGKAYSAPTALEMAQTLRPGIIVLDISLGKTSGLDLLPELLKVSPESRVIILTMHNDNRYLQEAMAKGAGGFVLKKAVDEDLLYAIRTVLRGEIYIHPSMISDFIAGGVEEEPHSSEAQLWHSLSQREQQVVKNVARGFTSREIADRLLLSEKTIATYRSRAMTKLGLNTRAELVQLIGRLDEEGCLDS